MQTFLPYEDFYRSAESLDYRRLGKQRVETLQLLQTMTGKSKGKGWAHHPALLMWVDYRDALVDYGLAVCSVWKSYGYKDTCYEKILDFHSGSWEVEKPWWLGSEDFHLSHQSNLIRKDREFYIKKFPGVSDGLPYVWPVSTTYSDEIVGIKRKKIETK